MNIDPETHREIVIVRRSRGDGEDSHHGGVWKIAYADFMTAMMAFFLVMWLINAANEETKAAVASYFNPVKLMDRNARPKGIQDSDEEKGKVWFERPDSIDAETKSSRNERDVETQPEREERQIFKDPYAVLAEIATDSGVLQNRSVAGAGGMNRAGPLTGAEGGEAYRDPFNPNYWTEQMDEEIFPLTDSPPVPPPSYEKSAIVKADGAKQEGTKIDQVSLAQRLDAGKISPEAANKASENLKPAKPTDKEIKPDISQAEIAQKLAAEIAKTGIANEKNAPEVTVVPTDEGVMIQLTDKVDYGMFAVGSAKPDKRVVQVLDEIGKIIASRKGDVIISGHTDARPFKSNNYDNWRLSSARAHMAYYMLTRGGLDAKRILRIDGYADRDPKIASDPYAAQNRRIDIFLKTAGR